MLRKLLFVTVFLLCTLFVMAQTIQVKRGPRKEVNIDDISTNSIYPDKLFIKFRPGFDVLLQSALAKNSIGNYSFGIPELDAINRALGVSVWRRSFETILQNLPYDATHKAWDLNRWYSISLPKNTDIKAAIKKYKLLNTIIETVELSYKRVLFDGSDPIQLWTPADSAYNLQWHYNHTALQGATSPAGTDADIDLPEAWELEKGKPAVVVAVIDGGVDTSHPDLRQNLWTGSGSERFGFNWNTNSYAIEPNSHGTHVCGTVAAVNNNGIGVSGIAGGDGTTASGARIMSLQIFSGAGDYAGDDATANAFVYAADHGASIAQCSWGGGDASSIITDAIDYFIMNGGGTVLNGGLAVFSAGNDYAEKESFPGNYPPVVCVAATDYDDKKPAYSSYGSWVDISAPGGETNSTVGKGILSTVPIATGAYYGWNKGTSMACPHVSGVAALCVSKALGKLGNEQLRDILLHSVDDIYPLNPSYIGKLGSGRINAFLAVQNAALASGATIAGVSAFTATQNCGQATLKWVKNATADNVIIAESDTLLFGTPTTALSLNDVLNGGGKIIYKGSGSSLTLSIPLNQHKYYRIWTYSGTTYSFHKTTGIIYSTVTSQLTLLNGSNCTVNVSWSDVFGCDNDSVLIIANNFIPTGTPSGILKLGDTIAGGAKVIYKGRGNTYNYTTNLDSVIYFQKWNFNALHQYTNPYSDQYDTIIKANSISAFKAIAATTKSIQLNWQTDAVSDCFGGGTYILTYHSTSAFGNPIGSYTIGDSILGGGKVIYVGSNTNFTHLNLNPNTYYCYKLWKVRNGNEYSAGKQVCINTICENSTILLPFAEGFNGADNSLPNVCQWDIENNTGNANAITIKQTSGTPTLTPVEGNAALRFNAYDIKNLPARLSSSSIKKGAGNSMDVLFRWYQDSSAYTNFLYSNEGVTVQWSSDRSSWQNLEFYPRVPVQGLTGWAYKQITLPQTAIEKDTVYISFLFNSAWGNNCYLDDLKLQITSYKQSDGIIAGAACENTDSITGWTNYYDSAGYRLLAIKKNGNNIGKAGQAGFDLKIGGNSGASLIPITGINYVTNTGGWACMNRYYSIKPIAEPASKIQLRFYYFTADLVGLSAAATTFSPPRANVINTDLLAYKINDISSTYKPDPMLGHSNIPWAAAYDSNGFTQYKNGMVADTATWLYTNLGNNTHSVEYAVGHLGSGGLGIGSIYGLGALQRVTYTFTGNGNWSDSNNWLNKLIPPTILPVDNLIIINPVANGQCVLDVGQQVLPGGVIMVNAGKNFVVKGSLTMENK